MRLSTKIITGIILSIFLLTTSAIIGLSFIDTEKYERQIRTSDATVSQENIITLSVEPFQAIKISYAAKNQREHEIYPFGAMHLQPVMNEEDKNKLSLPEELLRFVDIASSNDTLIIRINMDKIHEQYRPSVMERPMSGVNFFINTSMVDVINNAENIKIDIQNMTTEAIHLQTNGSVYIANCQADIITPRMERSGRFQLKDSQVRELNIDLDQMGRSWQIDNCDIEVENLTGSNRHNVNLPKSEAKIMNWLPKNADARLNITLRGDSAQVIFP